MIPCLGVGMMKIMPCPVALLRIGKCMSAPPLPVLFYALKIRVELVDLFRYAMDVN